MISRPIRVSEPELAAPRSWLNSTGKTTAAKILVVDDDAVILKVIEMRLGSKGYRVVTATDASQALNVARRECPDLVLVDVNFPPDLGGVDWNGFRLIQWLRTNEEVRDVPVIVMSGNERPEYQRRAQEMGAAGFLPKSMHSEGLVACIEMALSHKKTGRADSKSAGALGFAAQPAFRLGAAESANESACHLKLGKI